jgi:hypothetical protein
MMPTPLLLNGMFTLPFWPIARPLGSGVGSYHYPCNDQSSALLLNILAILKFMHFE